MVPPSVRSYLETPSFSRIAPIVSEKKSLKNFALKLTSLSSVRTAPFKSLTQAHFSRQSSLQILALSYTCKTKDTSFFQYGRWEGREDHLFCFSLRAVCGCSFYSRSWMLRKPQPGSFPRTTASAASTAPRVILEPSEINTGAVPKTEQGFWHCGRAQNIFFPHILYQAPWL